MNELGGWAVAKAELPAASEARKAAFSDSLRASCGLSQGTFIFAPRWGATDAEIKVPSPGTSELSKGRVF